ncbi:hypothetical protein L2Y94_19625 [Luteibacter aegosomatis]|uniref:hypothetical protein n=1 Tax=Luteibacter aegosomatis TaxID=2911537 RepID=UPI001FFA57DC|nr:hypothetical protein [Luteibacter aegosomatis]UPG85486.1 hypothetical protein L2Y94_19625 [Luteibacter aegosomatis]
MNDDTDTTIDTLLNEAGEYLQYAQGVVDLLIERTTEIELCDRRQTLLALGAVGVLMKLSTHRAMQAHHRWQLP